MSVSRSSGVSLDDLQVHLLEGQEQSDVENPSSQPVTSGSFQGREVTHMSAKSFAAWMCGGVTVFLGAAALAAYVLGYLSF